MIHLLRTDDFAAGTGARFFCTEVNPSLVFERTLAITHHNIAARDSDKIKKCCLDCMQIALNETKELLAKMSNQWIRRLFDTAHRISMYRLQRFCFLVSQIL